jgi:hypothetical protein
LFELLYRQSYPHNFMTRGVGVPDTIRDRLQRIPPERERTNRSNILYYF